jgi:hypothetical protein
MGEELSKLRDRYKKYTKLGEGSYRATYDLGNGKVAKIPSEHSVDCWSNTGISANIIELAIYKKFAKSNIFAKAELIWELGFPVLIMDKVEDAEPDKHYKARVTRKKLVFNDGFYQCGKNTKGTVVCYDYGNEFSFLTAKETKEVKAEYMAIYKKFSKKQLTAA